MIQVEEDRSAGQEEKLNACMKYENLKERDH
jgi:hypothetical protein